MSFAKEITCILSVSTPFSGQLHNLSQLHRDDSYSLLSNNGYHCYFISRVVGYLLETVLRLAIQPILEAECITECAGIDIGRIFRTLQRSRCVI